MKKRICIKFALCKYVARMSFAQLCTQCKCGDDRICPFLCKFGHCHLCTGCKALRISYLQHICTRQIWGKFDFSSSEGLLKYLFISGVDKTRNRTRTGGRGLGLADADSDWRTRTGGCGLADADSRTDKKIEKYF